MTGQRGSWGLLIVWGDNLPHVTIQHSSSASAVFEKWMSGTTVCTKHTHTHTKMHFYQHRRFLLLPSCVLYSENVQMIKWRGKKKNAQVPRWEFFFSLLPPPESCCHTSQMWLQINIGFPLLSAFRPWTPSHGRSSLFNICLFEADTLATTDPSPTRSLEVSLSADNRNGVSGCHRRLKASLHSQLELAKTFDSWYDTRCHEGFCWEWKRNPTL